MTQFSAKTADFRLQVFKSTSPAVMKLAVKCAKFFDKTCLWM